MSNPENKEKPNPSELAPRKDRDATIRQIGKTAIDGSKKK
jgi:hypothetical protein